MTAKGWVDVHAQPEQDLAGELAREVRDVGLGDAGDAEPARRADLAAEDVAGELLGELRFA